MKTVVLLAGALAFTACTQTDLSAIPDADTGAQDGSTEDSEDPPSSPPGPIPESFAIAGITGTPGVPGADATVDNKLASGVLATIQWENTQGESSYDVTILNSDDSLRCDTQTVAVDTKQVTFNSCALTEGKTYKAVVVAKNANGSQPGKNSPFSFAVSVPAASALKVTGPAAIPMNACIPYTVHSVTFNGANSPVTNNTTVSLSVQNTTGAIYSNSSCATLSASASIPAGSSEVTLYLKSPKPNSAALLVAKSATGVLRPSTLDVAIGTTQSSLLISGPKTILKDSCEVFSVSRLDSLGNKISEPENLAVSLSATDNGIYYRDALCKEPLVQTILPTKFDTTPFYFLSKTAVDLVQTASDAADNLKPNEHPVSVTATQQWWNSKWSKRIAITLNNLDQSNAFQDLPVLIKLDSSKISYYDTRDGGEDIRFILESDSTELSYEIEKWDETGTSYVWVKLDSLAASSETRILMYYGNASADDHQSSTKTWTSYTGVWHLSQSPTNAPPQFKDSGPNGTHGLASPVSPTPTVGPIGQALDFGGDVDPNFKTIRLPIDLSKTLGGTSTFSAWVRTIQPGGPNPSVSPGITGVENTLNGDDIFVGWLNASGQISMRAGLGGGVATSVSPANDNTWRHVTFQRDHLSGTITLYINGVFNHSIVSDPGLKTTSFNQFGLIDRTAGLPVDFNGQLDEIRLSGSVTSADRVKAEYKFQVDSHISYSLPEKRL